MKHNIFVVLITIAQLWAMEASAQRAYPNNYFRSPIENRIFLSGTFGELRGGHFHAGLDIKTGGVEGAKVMAAAEGWVSRIKISPYGYGTCVYVQHPNGYTTVYAHLQKIKGEAGKYAKQEQYRRKRFAVDMQLKAGQFPVKKGEVIALSGNSGGSGGPHLHFEIRDSGTQEPLNPLLFGIPVKDYFTPQIRSIRLYPVGKGAKIDNKSKAVNMATKGWGKTYRLKTKDTVQVVGDFYLGINTIDKQNDTHNKNGVFSIELRVDSISVYRHRLERINFATTRYINTLIDYPYYKTKKRRYQRSYQGANNKLKIAEVLDNKGVISLQDGKVHTVEYVVKDAPGNTSVLRFYVLAKPNMQQQPAVDAQLWTANQPHRFNNAYLSFATPKDCFYDTISFAAQKGEKRHAQAVSDTYIIGNEQRAMQKKADIRLKNIVLEAAKKDKAYVGRLRAKSISAYVAKWEGQDLLFKSRDMGSYAVFVDTIAPSIKYLTPKNKTTKPKRIRFRVSDKGSGIAHYNAYLNQEWVLLEWDPKTRSMFYRVDKVVPANSTFKIVVKDMVGNSNSKQISL